MNGGLQVIIDNLGYLLWGNLAQGEPGGVLLTLLMAAGAALLAFPGGLRWRVSPGGLAVWCAPCCFCGLN